MEDSGDMMSQMEMLDDNVVWHEIGSDEPIRGRQALMERYGSMPDGGGIKIETHDIIANDEHAIALVTASATMGGQSLTYRTAEIHHTRDGKFRALGILRRHRAHQPVLRRNLVSRLRRR